MLMKMLENLHELCEKLERELKDVNTKLNQSDAKINSDDLSIIDKLTHSIKSIKTVIAMEEYSDDYPEGSSGEGGWNYNRPYMTSGNYYGYSGARRMRDSMGRYTSRDNGYSRDASKKKMVQKLSTLLDDTMSESERMAIEECMAKIEK